MAPNLSGVASADQARAVHLGELALEFARDWLQPGGDLVVKAFQGSGFPEFQRQMQALRSVGDAAGFGDRDEKLKVNQIETQDGLLSIPGFQCCLRQSQRLSP